MHTYTLQHDQNKNADTYKAVEKHFERFSNAMVIDNIKWYCHFRWFAISFLFMFGALSFFPELYLHINFKPFQKWPFFVTAILAIGNLLFAKHAQLNSQAKTSRDLTINVWLQVVFDLLILTTVVYFVGSLETYIAFTYLFHIVLACIYFPNLRSLYVTLLAITFYFICILAEHFNLIPPAGIYLNSSFSEYLEATPLIPVYHIMSFIGVALVVWYFGSHLSSIIRLKDYELIAANHHLKETQLEKAKHLLRITHELKAPFAAIDANIQLLLKGHTGTFSTETMDVLERISSRSKKLGHEIQEMLQLANLRSVNNISVQQESMDLAEIIKWCISQVYPTAKQKGVIIQQKIQSAHVTASVDHMKMLFGNLISNAIIYSNEKDEITIECIPSADEGPVLTIKDNGIGIAGEKLPKIFDEYYRTDEAARHNKNSTGLGLTIVKHVAQSHHITVNVTSSPGEGTIFEVRFPTQSPVQ